MNNEARSRYLVTTSREDRLHLGLQGSIAYNKCRSMPHWETLGIIYNIEIHLFIWPKTATDIKESNSVHWDAIEVNQPELQLKVHLTLLSIIDKGLVHKLPPPPTRSRKEGIIACECTFHSSNKKNKHLTPPPLPIGLWPIHRKWLGLDYIFSL